MKNFTIYEKNIGFTKTFYYLLFILSFVYIIFSAENPAFCMDVPESPDLPTPDFVLPCMIMIVFLLVVAFIVLEQDPDIFAPENIKYYNTELEQWRIKPPKSSS